MLIKELEGAAIVLLGSFNPSIFSPAWFAARGLIRTEEANAAEIQVIHQEIASFTVGPFVIQVQKGRFTAQTTEEGHYPPLRDLVLGVFGLLEHTPIQQMGLNRYLHFKTKDLDQWHRIGHSLVPKAAWEEVLDSPGLRSLSVVGKPQEDGELKITTTVRVEPSGRIHPGVFIEVNMHHEAVAPNSTLSLMQALERSWMSALQRAEHIANHVIDKALE